MIAYGKKPVGFIEIMEGYYYAAYKKPCLWHRFWHRVFLGWKWHDNDPFEADRERTKKACEEYDWGKVWVEAYKGEEWKRQR